MKAFLALLILVIGNTALATPDIVLSQVCGYKYVEGIKIPRTNQQIMIKCLYKRSLDVIYKTHLKGKCYGTHVEGSRQFSSRGFDFKMCIQRSMLGEVYSTFHLNSCATGYTTDGVVTFYTHTYGVKYCVRDLK